MLMAKKAKQKRKSNEKQAKEIQSHTKTKDVDNTQGSYCLFLPTKIITMNNNNEKTHTTLYLDSLFFPLKKCARSYSKINKSSRNRNSF